MRNEPGVDCAGTSWPITSRAEFVSAVQWAVDAAIAGGARRMSWIDPDFVLWPLDDPALLEQLTTWLRQPQRRLLLMAANYDELPRVHPRFVRWRRDWAHAIEAWTPVDASSVQLPSLLVDDRRLSLQLVDAVHWRGRVEQDAQRAQLWREEIDALLQRCAPAFPVHHLGL